MYLYSMYLNILSSYLKYRFGKLRSYLLKDANKEMKDFFYKQLDKGNL